jgi:small GTP-binding protein
MSGSNASVKLILVGDSGAGKTSLVTSYLTGSFESDAIPTVAPAHSTSTVTLQDGSAVLLQIWDTAGQEAYLSISQNFYREADIALVCYTPAGTDSIDAWIARVHGVVPTCLIFLVATKADTLSEQGRLDLFNAGLERVQNCGAKVHYVTSAKTGLSVKEVFTGAAKAGGNLEHSEPKLTLSAERAGDAAGCC